MPHGRFRFGFARLRPALLLLLPLLAASDAGLATRAAVPTGLLAARIKPSHTDPAIRTFDEPHLIYLHRDIVVDAKPGLPAARRQLLLFLPGTSPVPAPGAGPAGGGTPGAAAFCQLAAAVGYHAIFLRYPNAHSASACARDADPGEFERFRLAIIEGGSSRHISVTRPESIEHRLIKLLQFLHRGRPREGWNDFLTSANGIRWENIAVAGQSQGGGHAVLIALKHRVARAIATGAPKDYNVRLGQPAAWLSAPSATPKSRFFTFNHVQDRQAATLEQQLENLRALQLDAFGAPVDVDTTPYPYRHARILLTDIPGGKKLPSREAHTAVISPRNAAHFDRVWRYLLTENTE